MSGKVSSMYEAAMAMTAQERAELAEKLLESIGDDDDEAVDQAAIDATWGKEADRRYQAYKRGEMGSISLEEFREMLKPQDEP